MPCVLCRLELVSEKFSETEHEFENTRKRARLAKQTFEKVKKTRQDRFQKCFDCMASTIDEIYKVLHTCVVWKISVL